MIDSIYSISCRKISSSKMEITIFSFRSGKVLLSEEVESTNHDLDLKFLYQKSLSLIESALYSENPKGVN